MKRKLSSSALPLYYSNYLCSRLPSCIASQNSSKLSSRNLLSSAQFRLAHSSSTHSASFPQQNDASSPAKTRRRRRFSRIDLNSLDPKSLKLLQREHKLHNAPKVFQRSITLPPDMHYKIPFITHEELAQDKEYMNGGSALLAFDLGQSYIGVAATPRQTRAVPVNVIKYAGKSIDQLAKAFKGEMITKKVPIAAVVIGVQDDYALQSSKLYKIIRQCWEKERIIVPILFENEYRTSKDAIHYLKTNHSIDVDHIHNHTKKGSIEKGKVDMIAAQFILQRAINRIHQFNMMDRMGDRSSSDELKLEAKFNKLAAHAIKSRRQHEDQLLHTNAKLNIMLDAVKEKRRKLSSRKKKSKAQSSVDEE